MISSSILHVNRVPPWLNERCSSLMKTIHFTLNILRVRPGYCPLLLQRIGQCVNSQSHRLQLEHTGGRPQDTQKFHHLIFCWVSVDINMFLDPLALLLSFKDVECRNFYRSAGINSFSDGWRSAIDLQDNHSHVAFGAFPGELRQIPMDFPVLIRPCSILKSIFRRFSIDAP